MDQPAEHVTANEPFGPCRRAFGARARWVRRHQAQRPMRSMGVVVLDELGEDATEMTRTDDQQVIQALAASGGHPALGEGIGIRRSNRGAHDLGRHRCVMESCRAGGDPSGELFVSDCSCEFVECGGDGQSGVCV